MSDSAYSFFDQLLHRLALKYSSIAEMSFDLDQTMVKTDPQLVIPQKHVFISGLARAGTTVLMRQFYETGLYRSLTYRDMPFVLAPNLWRRLSTISKRETENTERAHGDNLLVNADSPESLDEVFWRVFVDHEYLNQEVLKAHQPSDEIIQKYIRYVNAILSADRPRRDLYLSKNNNNILRLGAIKKAFPNALILIPFRDPLQHANSLFRQHCHFSKIQKSCKFTLSYMSWLGHHEFGQDHRPFHFEEKALSQNSPDQLEYWLHLWIHTYSWLEKSKPDTAMFICYEDLCARQEIWTRLAEIAGISIGSIENSFKLSQQAVDYDGDQDLLNQAMKLYGRLTVQSHLKLFG